MIRKSVEYLLFPPFYYSRKKLSEHVHDKTIVITGASFGIGEQLAIELSHCKVHLVLIARTFDKLQELKSRVEQNGSKATIISADLYVEKEVNKLAEQLKTLPGGIDVFVNNAGKSIMRSLSDSLDRYHDVTRTNSLNYLAPVNLLLAVTPVLKKQKGHVITISAINVLLVPAPYWSAYQASKTAFDQWFRCNMAEWKAMGIATSRVYLPLVRTRMIAPNPNYMNTPAMSAEHAAKIVAKLGYTKGRQYKPWWCYFAELSSVFGRRLFEGISASYVKRNTKPGQ